MTAHRLTLLAAALACGAMAFSALAQDGAPSRFAARDTNHDGYIDKSEASADMSARFDEMDTDHDGRLSPDEVHGFIHARWQDHKGRWGGGHRMDRLDANKDGKITWDEVSADAKTRFDALDTNHDGFIDDAEMAQMHGHHHHHDDNPAPAH